MANTDEQKSTHQAPSPPANAGGCRPPGAAARGARGWAELLAEQGQGPQARGLRCPSAGLLSGAAPGTAPQRLRGGACRMSFISMQSLRTSSQTPSASPAAVETASPAPPLRWPAGSSGDHVCAGSPHPRAHMAPASRSQPGLPGPPRWGGTPSPDRVPHVHREFVIDVVVGLPCQDGASMRPEFLPLSPVQLVAEGGAGAWASGSGLGEGARGPPSRQKPVKRATRPS